MKDQIIIEQIEKELNTELEITDGLLRDKSYSLNQNLKIERLSLDGCGVFNLNRIINLLRRLKELKHLSLSENHIEDIFSLRVLKNLTSLDLSHNLLTDISPLTPLKRLTELDLGGNQINEILPLEALTNLIKLDLLSNKIDDISSLRNLTKLTSLRLSWNLISNISPLENIVKLKELGITANHLNDISPLAKLINLKYLFLGSHESYLDGRGSGNGVGNNIKDISPLQYLINLEVLGLENNLIDDISPLKNLKKLNTLLLDSNPLKSLPHWITDFDMGIKWRDAISFQNGYISFSHNPLQVPPVEIIKRGKQAVRNYFKSIAENKRIKLNEVKVLLVGEGMAGKTSILKQFQGLPFNKDESQTHGINVVSIQAKDINGFRDEEGLKDFRIHFWDFGGQEIMHASHQFFMSQRSLYILVLDSRTDSKKYHWLKHIEKFGGDSPLIVVMNKIDANPSYNIQQQSINRNFPNIKNRFHRVSCETKEGMSTLAKCLATAIPETSLFNTVISIDWMNVKDKLIQETKANRYINRDNFIKICQESNVTDESSQQTLLQYLNDLGVVLYFKQLNLANIYVLDPHWVTIGVYKIINSAKTKSGILREQDLDYILNNEEIKKREYDPAREKNFRYTPEEQLYLLSIMMQFELCYEYDRNKKHYIIPDLLPKELKNEHELNGGTLLHFVMTYDYLPSTILSRLMLRLKNDIVKNQQWKYGMILDSKIFNCIAKIREDEPNKRIDITIQGEFRDKRQYFSVIRHHIYDINKDFENLLIQEYIPLPGFPQILIEYSELLGYEKANRDDYFVGKLGQSFSVSEMLDSVISKEDRNKEMSEKININLSNIGNARQSVNQQVKQSVKQEQTVIQEVKNVQGLFKNLKEDILDEVDLEFTDEKEKKRLKNDLNKVESALTELEKAASEEKQELPEATKGRLSEFIDNLSDDNSRLNKALKLVSNGAEKVQKLGKFYNNVAPYFALPSIPPFLLGKND